MKAVRPLVLFMVVIALLSAGVTAVLAHAVLLRSIPEPNASLPTSPPRVELFFSEAIAPRLSKISVVDSSGKQVDARDARADPADATHLLVSLPSLGDGVYIVIWSVISAADGHQTIGSFPFAVGKVDANALAMAGSRMPIPNTPTPVGGMVLRGLLYLAAATLTGGILFTSLVWRPSCRDAEVPPDDVHGYAQVSHALVLGALAVLVAADVLGLMVQAGQVSGASVGWPWQPEFLTLLFGTRVGVLGILRLGLAILLAAWLLPHPEAPDRWGGLVFCLLLLLSLSLQSHAAAEPHPQVPVLADWLHLIAVSVWVGGLFFFLGGMRVVRRLAPEPRTRLTSFLIPHFTLIAMISVGLLGLTGIYSAVLHVGTLDALLSTAYGRALIVKLLIAAPMLAMGAIHFLITTPSIRRAAAQPGGSPTLVARFRGLLAVESVLGVAILIWVGAFTALPPAQTVSASTGLSKTTRADDLSITLNIDPGQSGINTFTATITSGGKPVTNAQDVSLEFTSLSGMVPPSKAAMAGQGNGQYRLQGGYLGMPDSWDIKVVVVRPGKFDAYADFKFDLSGREGQTMP